MHVLILYIGAHLTPIHTQYLASTVLYWIIKSKNRLTLAKDWVIDIIGITTNTILIMCTIETSMILVLCLS